MPDYMEFVKVQDSKMIVKEFRKEAVDIPPG